MDKRIKAIGKSRYLIWKFEEKIWKVLNKIFRANYYNPIHKPKWIPNSLYSRIKKVYEIRVEEPYRKMIQEEMKEEFSKNPKLQKFENYL